MTLLNRYLVRQNLFLITVILLISTGLYVLTDMFERLDIFLESEAGLGLMLLFFLVKIPGIISMTLPAVFMIAVVVQMNMLERSRELVALTAGGISPLALVRFIILYGIIWAVLQFAFAQVLGVAGERTSSRIWQEEVRGRAPRESALDRLWFTEKNHIVYVGKAWPLQGRGEDLKVYTLDRSGIGIKEIIKAEKFTVREQGWQLEEGEVVTPSQYSTRAFTHMDLALYQDLRSFLASVGSGLKPKQLSLMELSEAIARLEHAGSNVEALRTAWHEKLAYACSIVIMGILALLVTRYTSNIYKAIVLSLVIVFFYYGVNTLCTSMGEKGLLKAFVGAWFADMLFFCAGLLGIMWPVLRARFRKA